MAKQRRRPAPAKPTEALRFEATLGTAPRTKTLAVAAELALDRLPDVDRTIRLLISPDDARRLLERGYEVHLKAAVPVEPLSGSLIPTDEAATAWLEKALKNVLPKRAR